MKTTLFALLLILASVKFFAEDNVGPNDAYELREQIHSSSNYLQGVAMGYIRGVMDARDGITHCSPAKYRHRELVEVVDRYLTDHPEQLHKNMFDALGAAYPCPPPGPPRMIVQRPRIVEEEPIPKKP